MRSGTDLPSPTQRGFSILELLVSMLIAIEVLVAAAIAFDVHNHLAVVQTQVTDLQQSLRIAQFDIGRVVRMAGRGGLPVALRPDATYNAGPPITGLGGLALEVRNNVSDGVGPGDPGRNIARGDADSPLALEGTDILTVRGCFSTPIYQINPGSIAYSGSDATLPIPDRSTANIRQPLDGLCDELRAAPANVRPAMILVSPEALSVYGVAEVTGHSCGASGTPPSPVNLTLKVLLAAPDIYQPLNPLDPPETGTPTYPANLEVALACLLEEYRYYVREVRANPADPTSELRPRLTRARFMPGTELPYNDDPQNFSLDLADGVFDLQVALGLDTHFPSTSPSIPGAMGDDIDLLNGTNDEIIFEGTIADDNRNRDDWLFNDDRDDPTAIEWRQQTADNRIGDPVNLYFVRVTTLARTNRADRKYRAPDIDPDPGRDFVEDHDYTQAPADEFLNEINRKFRRRALTTIIEPRNVQ